MFRNISIGRRIIALIIVMSLFVAATVVVFVQLTDKVANLGVSETQRVMLKDHKARLQLATLTFANAVGKLIATAPEDQKEDLLRQATYTISFEDDNSGYFFVYKGTTVVAHPVKKDSVGQNNDGSRDPNGVYVIRGLAEAAQKGGDFVEYVWPKPNMGTQPKLSYAMMIPGSDYWVGTGVYIDNVDAEKTRIASNIADLVNASTITTVSILAAILLLIILPASIAMSLSITRPLREATVAANAVAQGNLDVRITPTGRDEVAQLQSSLGTMVTTLKANIEDMEAKGQEANRQTDIAREALRKAEEAMQQAEKATREGMLTAAGRLEGVVSRISTATSDLAMRSEEIRQGTENQMTRISETATAMEEMNATVLEVARNASEAAEQTEKSREKALQGSSVVSETVKSMNALQTITTNLKDNMHNLGEQSVAIGQVMNVINDIADQTNLLALNAAIEAARAGEAGRGFAVVADEVRKLAEKTMGATKEVGESIKSIQNLAKANVTGMDEAVDAINGATELSNQSGQVLYEIVSMAQEAAMQVQSIATAAEQQSAASEQITSSVDEINRIANENAQRVAESDNDIQQLAGEASELSSLVDSLKDDAGK
ncbi:methyl-accepting chemotaxis protein [Desulfovibrio subterraneus]|uniref:Methyl-accepting chemotaxis protein n=1 Tax=Desulfovibrio subterraneus TaxID=2718620 RepID=A0A7J0BPU3_9BACT|nr:methyl-accepting chemotaxis protein [Desulfovibrio subterraneus]WBF65950.1 methyl-accepting chemotaxis protein [Desulfovibrio subterraneus]GFM35222.1 methyl-accepting chemotaxis protein [Desulfovibrio subterraneus]